MLIFQKLHLLFSPKKQYEKELTNILGFTPNDKKIYELAFTHRSASLVLQDGSIVNNERLEFLGDAILDAVIAEYLFAYYPNEDEGYLSKMRSKIVKRKHLDNLAIKVGINQLIVSNAINQNGGKHICGNAFEALIGAVYLDKGYLKTRKFLIDKIIKAHIDLHELETIESDYKSRIIEWAQKNRAELNFDSQEEEADKEHAPTFISRVIISNQLLGQGKGSSKKEAEQNAAEEAFLMVNTLD